MGGRIDGWMDGWMAAWICNFMSFSIVHTMYISYISIPKANEYVFPSLLHMKKKLL